MRLQIAVLMVLSVVSLQVQADTVPVNISGFTYTPSTLNVLTTDVVSFAASGFHPLRIDALNLNCTNNCQVSFPNPGSFIFFCTNHGSGAGTGMFGRVNVEEGFRNGFE
jgi:plastocyanin